MLSDIIGTILTRIKKQKVNHENYIFGAMRNTFEVWYSEYMQNDGVRGAIKYYGQEVITLISIGGGFYDT